MTPTRTRCLALLLTAVVGIGLAACAKSDAADAPGEGAAFATQPPKTAPPTTAAIGAECTDALVSAAAATKYPKSQIADRFCTKTFAIATIFPAGGPKPGLVGFFTGAADVWTLVADAPTSNIDATVPPDFPADLVNDWKGSYVDPTKATTTTTAAGNSACVGNADVVCTTSPTTKPPTTTTSTTKATSTTATTVTTSKSTPSSPVTTAKVTTTTAGGTGLG